MALNHYLKKIKQLLENRIKEIEDREVVEKIEDHDPVEIPCEKGKITIGSSNTYKI